MSNNDEPTPIEVFSMDKSYLEPTPPAMIEEAETPAEEPREVEALVLYGDEEDDPQDLFDFRPIAEPVKPSDVGPKDVSAIAPALSSASKRKPKE